MNLVIFIHSLSCGGAERVTANLANHWAGKGWQVAVVTLASKSLDFYELHPGVERIALNLARESANPLAALANNLRRILAFRRVLRKHRPDVALAMMSMANVLLALAVTGLRGIVTVGSERIHPPQLPLGGTWDALRSSLYRRLTTIVALTQESAAWLRQHTKAQNVAVIPNAVPWPLPIMQPHLEPLVKPKGCRVLLAAGRLCEQKGFDLLITVFQRLVKDFPDWTLAILGEGPERKSLRKQVESAGLSGRILMPGRTGNVGQWYEAVDLYVMSSRFEGFPNTLAEALAHGVPVVSFDCDTGPRDIIRHEIDGLLVPAGNTGALERALRRMMTDESLRRRFAVRAIEARERFSLDRIAGIWEQLFKA